VRILKLLPYHSTLEHNRTGVFVDIKGVKRLKGYGKKIKHYRNIKKIKQRTLAEKLGVTDSYVSKLENEKTALSVETLLKIAEILEVQPGDLVDNQRYEPSEELKNDGVKWVVLGKKLEELNVTPEQVEEWARIAKSYVDKK
jgi:transcriptional regulator with XRE-family HTH domain